MTMKILGRYLSCFQIQENASQLRVSDITEIIDFGSSDHVKEVKQNQGGFIFG